MPNFKPKSIKKIKFNKKTAVTLDTKHKEFLTEFTNDETDVIPELKAERHELKTKLLNEYDELTLEARIELEDKVAEITTRIRDINAKKKEYFLDNSKFIFEYFENKKDISVGSKYQTATNKSKLVNTFFKIKRPLLC